LKKLTVKVGDMLIVSSLFIICYHTWHVT
jgi:hypothetical protein